MLNTRKYKKYKNAGLPVMAYENNEMHYLNFFKTKNKKGKEKIEAYQYELLSEALGDIINDGFYYSFNTLVLEYDEEGNKKEVVGHSHAHDFESVVREVYYNPNVFSIDEEDRKLYSDQEYKFLMKIKSYLMAVKREDISFDATIEEINDLALNADASLFRDYPTKTLNGDDKASLIIEKKRKYFISSNVDSKDDISKNRYLLADNYGKYLGLIEVVKKKVLRIEDITEKDVDYKLEGFRSLNAYKKDLKEYYKNNLSDFNDRSEIVINTVKVIRKFK